jgi:hypothetical protein
MRGHVSDPVNIRDAARDEADILEALRTHNVHHDPEDPLRIAASAN